MLGRGRALHARILSADTLDSYMTQMGILSILDIRKSQVSHRQVLPLF